MALSRSFEHEFNADTKIDLSPMIDCVFILLIFFIVTTVFVEEIGIPVKQLEITGSPPVADPVEPLTLEVSSSGVVRYHGRNLDTNAVSGLIQQVLTTQSDLPVLIIVEPGAKQQLFAEVYGNVRAGGATKISFK